MRVRLSLAALLLLPTLAVGAAPALAQGVPADTASATRLTLDQALGLALGRNLDLAQARTNVALAGVSVDEDRAAFGPSLSVTAGPTLNYARSGGAVIDTTGGGVLIGSGGSLTTGLSANAQSSLTLFDAGQRRANLAQSRAQLAAQEATLSRAEEQALYLTATQYLTVLQNVALVRVYEEALAAQRQQLDVIEAFFEAGNRSLADVLQQRATIAQARQTLVTAEQAVGRSLLDLKQTLRLDPAAPVAVAPVDTAAVVPVPALDAAALAALAVERRRDVEAQELQTTAAESAVRAAEAGRYPSVSAGLSAGSAYTSGASDGLATQFFDTRPNAGLSLGITVPILDRRQTRSAVERARLSLDSQQLTLAAVQQQAGFEAEQAALNVAATAARLAAAEAQRAAAAEALDAARERYRVGAGTFAELADAQALAVDAEGQVAQARYQNLLDRVALGYAVGDLLPALDALR